MHKVLANNAYLCEKYAGIKYQIYSKDLKTPNKNSALPQRISFPTIFNTLYRTEVF